jgi:hypothetical protein
MHGLECVQGSGAHFSRALKSFSLLASSSLRKSFVFWARSLRWVRVSRWWATRSEATVSSCGTRAVRSMSASEVSACRCYGQGIAHSATRRWPFGTCSPLQRRLRRARRRLRGVAHPASWCSPRPRGSPWERAAGRRRVAAGDGGWITWFTRFAGGASGLCAAHGSGRVGEAGAVAASVHHARCTGGAAGWAQADWPPAQHSSRCDKGTRTNCPGCAPPPPAPAMSSGSRA